MARLEPQNSRDLWSSTQSYQVLIVFFHGLSEILNLQPIITNNLIEIDCSTDFRTLDTFTFQILAVSLHGFTPWPHKWREHLIMSSHYETERISVSPPMLDWKKKTMLIELPRNTKKLEMIAFSVSRFNRPNEFLDSMQSDCSSVRKLWNHQRRLFIQTSKITIKEKSIHMQWNHWASRSLTSGWP